MKKIYKVDDTYILRTPIFPLEILDSIKEKDDIVKFYESNKIMQEGISLATHNLGNSQDITYSDNFILSVYKYIIRMASRSTPYGIFSGVSIGDFSDQTSIVMSDACKHSKGVMPDMEWVQGIIKKFFSKKEFFDHVYIKKNPNCYQDGVFLKNPYITGIFNNMNKGKNVSVFYSELLGDILLKLETPLTYCKVISFVEEKRPQIERGIIENYIKQLISNEIIITELIPPLINCNPLIYLENIEKRINKDNQLQCLRKLLGEYEISKLGEGKELLSTIKKNMKKNVHCNNLLKVDTKISYEENTIHKIIKKDIEKVVSLLVQLSPSETEKIYIQQYKSKFINKYGYFREVNLLELFDEDKGIGNPISSLEGIEYSENDNILKLRGYLFRKIEKAVKLEQDVYLEEDELKYYCNYENKKNNYPLSLEIYLEMIVKDNLKPADKDFEFVLTGCKGSLGAGKTFGRFAYLFKEKNVLENVHELTKNLLGEQTILVELDEMVKGVRANNIGLNSSELIYQMAIGTNTTYQKERIELKDLFIGVNHKTNQFYVKSKKLDKQIIFQNHNMLNAQLGSHLYRFLRDITYNNTLDFKRILEMFSQLDLRHIPAIRYNNVILQPELWRLYHDNDEYKNDLELEIKQWIIEQNIPKICYLYEGDNRLLINLENSMSQWLLVQEYKKKKTIELHRCYQNLEHSWIKNINGQLFFGEFVFSLFLDKRIIVSNESFYPISYRSQIQRDFLPGDEWVYLKFYCNPETVDKFITNELHSFCNEQCKKYITQYFFIKYYDPKFHLRLRMKLKEELTEDFIKVILKWSKKLKEIKWISTFAFDTYERETERYGGDEVIELAEDFFCADTYFVEAILQMKKEGKICLSDEEIAIASISELLNDFAVELENQEKLFEDWANNKYEFRNYFNENKEKIIKAITIKDQKRPEYLYLYEALRKRSFFAKIYNKKFEEIYLKNKYSCNKYAVINSLIHMFCNRFKVNNEWERMIRIIMEYGLHTYYGRIKHLKKE